ncbi:hypothetical protein NUSPORA_01574 [Nucleospora cyclopteri]
MNNLINKIRNNKNNNRSEDNNNEDNNNKNNNEEINNQNNNRSEEINKQNNSFLSETSFTNDTLIIRTSQPDILAESTNKLSLNSLFDKLKELNRKHLKINKIKEAEEFKVNKEFYVIVKNKEIFRDTYKLELVDETGNITGHTNIQEINVGNILLLKNCSLWKLEGNQLNIVRENLIERLE